MKESRKILIKNKIITKNDLENIASIFSKEYNNSKKGDRNTEIKFQISCDDNSTYESESKIIIDDGGIIDIKKASSIEFSYYDYSAKRRIEFYIREDFMDSYVKVSGDDSGWVNKIFNTFCEHINSLSPQNNWILKYKRILQQVIALGLGKFFFIIVGFFSSLQYQPIRNPSNNLLYFRSIVEHYYILFNLIFDWLIPWLFGLAWAQVIFYSFDNYWPKVEFDFGPEHLKKYKNKRKLINSIITLVIIPSILMILYDLAKQIF